MTHSEYDPSSRNLHIFLQIDFTRLVVTYNYKSYSDLISKLGGLKSFIQPLFGIIGLLSSLHFLVEFGKIIIDQYKLKYKTELIKTVQIYYEMLN